MERRITKLFQIASFFVGGLALILSPLQASISWTNWSAGTSGTPGTASGNISLISTMGVSYTGQTSGLLINYPSWTPVSSFTGGAVSNAPPSAFNSVALEGGTAETNTINFSSPILNPVFAIWSLGAENIPASFDFTSAEPFVLVAGGPDTEYRGSSITTSGNDVLAAEGSGVIQFNGIFSQITWTNPSYEYYYAFTVGAPEVGTTPTPEPDFRLVAGLGIALILLLRSRVN